MFDLIDTIAIIVKTSTSVILSVTEFKWIVLPISSGVECGLSTSDKVL